MGHICEANYTLYYAGSELEFTGIELVSATDEEHKVSLKFDSNKFTDFENNVYRITTVEDDDQITIYIDNQPKKTLSIINTGSGHVYSEE